jgi:hypothetical protein
MLRSDVKYLCYIVLVANLGSIARQGILSNDRMRGQVHGSVADPLVQARRDSVRVPGKSGSRELHSYANLYFNARNAMMYRVHDRHAELCVVQVSPRVLDLPDVVLTDCNAASGWCRFSPSPEGLGGIDGSLVFARDWTSPDEVEYFRRKSAVNAEVLVPDAVMPNWLVGVLVSCKQAATEAARQLAGTPLCDKIAIDRDTFFV